MTLNIQTNRFLSEFSTFGIGGPIDHCVEVRSIEEAKRAYAWARSNNLPVLVVGKGSNSLFDDAPFRGLVLCNRIDFCERTETEVHVGAGYSFSLLGVQTAKQRLSGLEFASGIPATVGGAVFMNAGANGQETADTLRSVLYLHESGEIQEFARDELAFSYRTSSFQTLRGCILAARFSLAPSDTARQRQLLLLNRRIATQPYKDKSAGCVFRNPTPEVAAGSLIDRCGLKGLSVGAAQVSEKHANFLINAGGASAADVRALIALVQQKVFEETGIHLESEIRVMV